MRGDKKEYLRPQEYQSVPSWRMHAFFLTWLSHFSSLDQNTDSHRGVGAFEPRRGVPTMGTEVMTGVPRGVSRWEPG
jgi:hypothetical protein